MKLKFLFITLFIFSLSFAQNKGTITGTITDKDMDNETLPFASVAVKGTSTGANSDENGKYKLSVPAGNHTLIFAFLGYETVEVQVTVAAGETKVVNQALASTSVEIEEVVIQRTVSREKESALLLQQKEAVTITQAIGAQEMSRKGVSDAEGAVTKVTGVSKQQGEKNVFVRGLGDRYNSTTLNGLPLPSEDPEYKNISLDFFSSDIIQSVNVNKTFSSEIYGDVGGANIDIISKEFSGNDYLEIGMSTGINTATYNKDFYTIDGGNMFLGNTDKEHNVTDLNSYNFENNLNPNMQSLQLNSSLTAAGGKRFKIGKKNSLTMYLLAGYGNSYSYREGKNRQTTNTGTVFQDMDYKRYIYNVNQTVMGNFKYRFGESNTLSFNTIYIHDNNQDLNELFGRNDPQEEGDLEFVRRQQINNNNLFVNQLLLEQKLAEKWKLDAGVSYNIIDASEPDRRINEYLYREGTFRPSSNSAGNHQRYFSTLDENDLAGKAIVRYAFQNEQNTKIDAGYNFRSTQRDFEAIMFNHRFPNSSFEIDIDNADALFNQESIDNGTFQLQTDRGNASNPEVLVPFFYDGKRTIHAGLASITHSFTPDLTVVAGGRFEKINQEVVFDTNIADSDEIGPALIDENYILPNLNVKYSLNEKQIIRMAASMSYTLPQFKEVAPFKYQDISFSSQGNPDLRPSDNYHFDLKWEYYPEADEIIAVTGFFKYIENAIARSEIISGGNTLTYLNVGGKARAMGLELELRKNIYKLEETEANKSTVFSGGANISYLNTAQQLENPLAVFNKEEDELQGASPWLINADITFKKKTQRYELTSSIIGNYFSDRIFSIGTNEFENIIEKGVPTLDFINKVTLGENFGITLKARNLLNPQYQLSRESAGVNNPETVLSEYRLGIDLSLGLSYKF